MRHYFLLPALFAAFAFTAAQAPAPEPEGLWLTQNKRSAIEVYKCGAQKDELCGRIAWIIPGGMQYDTKNPNMAKRGNPLCGMTLMYGLKPTDPPAEWDDGKVYKADEGTVYDVDLDVIDQNTLEIRGYLGIALLGKTQTWTKVSARDYPRCKAPPKKQ